MENCEIAQCFEASSSDGRRQKDVSDGCAQTGTVPGRRRLASTKWKD
jgi:hypothetical protein